MVRVRLSVLTVFVCLLAPGFAGAAEAPLFSRPRAIAATSPVTLGGDFNLDGKMDLLSVAYERLGVLYSNGDGTFQAPRLTTIETPASFFGLGDVNNDGRPDLLTSDGVRVRVAVANADGTFTQTALLQPATRPGPLAVADFTGDGKADLATVSPYNQSEPVAIVVFPGNANGTFGSSIPTPIDGWEQSQVLLAADVNEDGKMDVLGSSTEGMWSRLGNGNGTFGTRSTIGGGGSLAVGDFNGDGHVDCAAASGSGEFVTIHRGTGAGGWTAGPKYAVPAPSSVAAADLNGDGKLDVVTGSMTRQTSVFLGNGDGTLSAGRIYASGGGLPAIADFTGDGKLDVAGTHKNGDTAHAALLIGNGDGTLAAPRAYATRTDVPVSISGPQPHGLTLADATGDGRPDAITWTKDGFIEDLTILPGLAGGHFGPPQHTRLAIKSGHFADFTGDGKVDVVHAQDGTIFFYRGNGDGTFTRGSDGSTPSYPAVTSADFNGDGKRDLFGAGGHAHLGNGDGTFAPAWEPAPVGGNGFRTGDVNGDGRDDVVTPHRVSLSTGTGFTTSPLPEYAPSYDILALMDLDRDDELDMVLSTYGGELFLRKGNGDGTFAEYRRFAFNVEAGLNPAVADMNGDGDPDLVFASHVLLGDGVGAFDGYEAPETHNAGSVAVADLDGNGSPDVVTLGQDTVAAFLTRTGTGADLPVAFSAASSLPDDAWIYPVQLQAEAGTASGYVLRGAVRFRTGERTLGMGVLDKDGKTGMSTFMDMGVHNITATFLRNDLFASTGTAFQQQVTKVQPEITLTITPNPVRATRTVTFTLYVWPESPSSSMTGTLTVRNGTTILRTYTLPMAGPTVRFTTSQLAVGTHTITADYAGDDRFFAATQPVELTVVPNAPDVALSVSPYGSALRGSNVTMTATLSIASAIGTVTFWSTSQVEPLGTATVNSGVATLSTTALPTGTYNLLARYNGSAAYAGASSPQVPYSVVVPSGISVPVAATAQSTTSVSILWPPVQNANWYDLYRSSHGSPYALVTQTTALQFTDGSRTPGTTYLYRVIARNGPTAVTPTGTPDLATTITFTDDPLAAQQTAVRAVHLTQLRTAIAAVRVAAGLVPFAYSRTIAAGGLVQAQDIAEMRTALQQARTAIGLATPVTGPLTAGSPMKALHVQELRDLVE